MPLDEAGVFVHSFGVETSSRDRRGVLTHAAGREHAVIVEVGEHEVPQLIRREALVRVVELGLGVPFADGAVDVEALPLVVVGALHLADDDEGTQQAIGRAIIMIIIIRGIVIIVIIIIKGAREAIGRSSGRPSGSH